MKNKYNIKIFLFLFMFIFPFFIDGLTYNDALDISGNFINNNDYKKSYSRYIYTPTNYEKFYSEDYDKFNFGGLLSYDEFITTLVNQKDKISKINYSYLYESKQFWTLTRGVDSSKNIVIGNGYPNVSREALNSTTYNIGTKVTEYTQNNVRVNGAGTYNNPWIFAPTYKVVIKVNDFSKGYILEGGSKVEQVEYAIENSSILKYIDIGTLGANEYIGSTCGYIINDIEVETNNKLLLSNVTRDIECIINFGETPLAIKLDQQLNDYKSIPETLYVLPQKGWYSDPYGNSQVTNLTVVPSKIGYTFKGYYNSTSKDNACSASRYIDENGKLTKDESLLENLTHGQTLYPCYEANSYLVTFDANDEGEGNEVNPATKTVTFNEPYGTLASVSRTGYTFAGWYNSKDVKIIAFDRVMTPSNHTLYAKWNKNLYNISYVMNGGSKGSGTFPTSAYYSDSVYIDAPTRVGYTFAGWLASGDLNTSTATYGSSASSVTTNAISSTTIIETRYVANLSTKNDGSVTLTAQWTANDDTPYVVNHYQQNLNASDEENMSNYTLVDTENLKGTTDSKILPKVKSYTGFNSPSKKSLIIFADGSSVLNYYYTRIHCSVTIGVNNSSYGSVSSTSVTLDYGNTYSVNNNIITFSDGTTSTASVIDATGYTTTFTDWSSTTGTISNDISITANFKRTANTNTAYKVRHYKQNIADDNYTLADTENLTGTTGASVTPNTKSYTGFTAPSKQTKNIAADGSLIIDYYYARNSYTVTINKGTGVKTVSGGGEYRYGASITVSYTMNTGYHYTSITGDKTSATFTMPASNVSVTVNGEANTYTVTYDCNGGLNGASASSHTYDIEKKLTANTCTKSGSKFNGWNSNVDGSGTSYDDQESVKNLTSTNSANYTVYAQWTPEYEDKWIKGKTGTTEFERTSHDTWASGGPVRLIWEEYYNAKTNQSYIYFSNFQATSGSAVGVMYVGGDNGETKGIFIVGPDGTKETIQQMSHYLGDTKFNFLYSNVNTWINLNKDDTNPPWTSREYDHDAEDGTLTLTFMVDLRMMTKSVSSVGRWNAVTAEIELTDLRN